MSYLCLYFQAHQPRRLNRRPNATTPFNDVLDREILDKLAATTYLPGNQRLSRLVRKYDNFHISVGISGTLIEQARRFHPSLLKSFQDLADTGRETGRIEFVGETYYHSLAGLFEDRNKGEFRDQIRMHREAMKELLGVEPTVFRNTELLFNNTIADIAADCGYKAIICEKRDDMVAGKTPDTVFFDRHGKIKIVPRNGDLSNQLLACLQSPAFEAEEFAAWVGKIVGEMTLVGTTYEALGSVGGRNARGLEFWDQFPQAIARRPNVIFNSIAGTARSIHDCPAVNIDDLATSSWGSEARNTDPWLGNTAQRKLFQRYQDLENRVKVSGNNNLVQMWRYLGAADHFYKMSIAEQPVRQKQPEQFDYITDASEAIMVYTTLLTELASELEGRLPNVLVKRKTRRPRILLVTPEVTELPQGMGNLANMVSAKGGGLADISAALVTELTRLGLDVHVALPRYERQMREQSRISQQEMDRLIGAFKGTEPIHLVQDSAFSHLTDVYEPGDVNVAVRRATAFQRNVINSVFDEAMPEHGKMLVHCNDWMTGLIPAAARARGFASLFTFHNIHSGAETLRNLEQSGIDVSRFAHDLYLEKHPDSVANPWEELGVDFLLSGLKAADYINTVSPTFLNEIVNGYFPDLFTWQLREAIRVKYSLGCACGILNAPKGIDDPSVARGLVRNYTADDVVEGKLENKIEFQRRMGLQQNPEAPIFYWPHRLYHQKGPHLVTEIALALVDHYRVEGLQIAFVANGDQEIEKACGTISCGSGGNIAYRRFNAGLSELGKAASDFILMPSLYEPCGLPQMEGMRFGTLPIVRATGGLRDTVEHLNIERNTGNGFVFNDFVPDALWWAVSEAMHFWNSDRKVRARITQRVMREAAKRFTLENTTLHYVRIYEQLLGEKLL